MAYVGGEGATEAAEERHGWEGTRCPSGGRGEWGAPGAMGPVGK